MSVPPRHRHALVTGASRGIGAAIARALAADGCRLTLAGRDTAALQALRDSLPAVAGGDHGVQAFDVADADAVHAGVAAAAARRGPVDVLVNNAGIVSTAPFLATPPAEWQRLMQVNLLGAVHCTQAVLPAMRAAGWGRVVQVASTAALKGYAYVSAYTAAKHAVLGFTRALAQETATWGVTVNAVCPGYTDTDIVRDGVARIAQRTGRTEAQALAAFVQANPQGRLVQPDEVASLVAWLAGDAAAAVHGQALAVSGGETP